MAFANWSREMAEGTITSPKCLKTSSAENERGNEGSTHEGDIGDWRGGDQNGLGGSQGRRGRGKGRNVGPQWGISFPRLSEGHGQDAGGIGDAQLSARRSPEEQGPGSEGV